MKMLSCLLFLLLFGTGSAEAGIIQYVATGKPAPAITVAVTRDNGNSWTTVSVKPGQAYAIPRDATQMTINGTPYPPQRNYKVREGRIR
ncbi:hypothetical protein [uncultured Desulfovibrio sp.]|uniref:hypothetical protein n=1 Tax=uncultured Desulfovibrio sp. TaxID=167968 RepID=UPI0026325DA5|nr:hypothetical protein [uncultured Desulfovibrio sp.]